MRKVVDEEVDNDDPFLSMDIDISHFLDNINDEESKESEESDPVDLGPALEVLGAPSPHAEPSTSSRTEPSVSQNGDDDTINIDEKGNIILPEGTVMVQPEDVDAPPNDKFSGPEFPTKSVKGQCHSGEAFTFIELRVKVIASL